MDLAYDHIQEDALPKEEEQSEHKEKRPETTLNSDFQEAYKAISSSPWGAKLGGFFGSVVKQVNIIYLCPNVTVLICIGRVGLQGSTARTYGCK